MILPFIYVIIMVTLRIHILMDVTYLTLNYKIINRNKQKIYKKKKSNMKNQNEIFWNINDKNKNEQKYILDFFNFAANY